MELSTYDMGKLAPPDIKAYLEEKDARVAAGIARALMVVHRTSHLTYKPDENARSNATLGWS